MEHVKKLGLTSYELLLYFFLFVDLAFLVYTANLYINKMTTDPIVLKILILSIAVLIMGLFGAWAYDNLGRPINYTQMDYKYLPLAMFLLLSVWVYNYMFRHVDIFHAEMASAISPEKLVFYLKTLSPLFVIMLAFIENLIFVVCLPVIIIEDIFETPLDKATLPQMFVAAVLSGIAAAIFHIAWKPTLALISTFLYFTAWALATLLLKNSILADTMHMVGNALGILYVTINPQAIIWSVIP